MTLSTSVRPVLLGGGRLSFRIALSLFFRYMLSSHVFAHAKPFYRRMPLFAAYHSLPEGDSDSIILMALEHMQREYGESTYLLIPCDVKCADFVTRNKDALEKRFIVRYPDEILKKKDIFPLS